MSIDFVTCVSHANTNIILRLNPQFLRLPLPIQRYDDPFLPFGKALIAETRDVVCGYMFDLASYMAMGAAGAIALERTIGYINREQPIILHAGFSLLEYVNMVTKTQFYVDAVTVTSLEIAQAFVQHEPYMAFVMEETKQLHSSVGYYDEPKNRLNLLNEQSETIQLRVTDNAVLYAGHGDDFAQQTRQAILSL